MPHNEATRGIPHPPQRRFPSVTQKKKILEREAEAQGPDIGDVQAGLEARPTFDLNRPLPNNAQAVETDILQTRQALESARTSTPRVPSSIPGGLSFLDSIKAAVIEFARFSTMGGPEGGGIAPTTVGPTFSAEEAAEVFGPIGTTPADIEAARQLTLFREMSIQLADRLLSLETRRVSLITVPLAVKTGSFTTAAEALEKYASFVKTPEDKQFLRELVDATLTQVERGRRLAATTDERKNLIANFSRTGSISPYGINILANENVLEVLRDVQRPRPPENLTVADALEIMEVSDLPSEQAQAIIDAAADDVAVVLDYMSDVNTRMALLKSDLRSIPEAELAQLIADNSLTQMFSAPGTALLRPWGYYKKFADFFAGGFVALQGATLAARAGAGGPGLAAATAVQVTPGDFFGIDQEEYDKFHKQYLDARTDGQAWAGALSYAFDNWDSNGLRKFSISVLADPLTYFGFGLTYPLKSIPVIGALAGFERGYVRFIDASFVAIKNGIFNTVGALKTPGQMAAWKAMKTFQVFAKSHADASLGRSFFRMSAVEIRSRTLAFVRDFESIPNAQGPLADIARIVTERPMLTLEDVARIRKTLNHTVEIDKNSISEGFVAALDRILKSVKSLNGPVTSDAEAVSLLLKRMDMVANETNVNLAIKVLQQEKTLIDDQVQAMLSGMTPKQIMNNILNHTRSVTLQNAFNPSSAYHMRLAAMTTSLSRVPAANQLLHALALMDTVSYGFARSYLMFGLFSPQNILELAWKTAYAGKYPLFKGNPIKSLVPKFSRLTNIPEQFLRQEEASILLRAPEAGAQVVRVSGSKGSIKGYNRAVVAKHNFFSRVWKNIDNALIRNGNRMILRQSADLMDSLFTRQMWDAHPEVMQAIVNRVDIYRRGLINNGIPEGVADTIAKEMTSRATHAPETVSLLVDDFSLMTVGGGEVAETVGKYNLMGPEYMDLFLEMNERGVLFPGLMNGSVNDEVVEMIWGQALTAPELFRANFRRIVETMRNAPPGTLDQFREQMQAIQMLADGFQGTITTEIKNVRANAQTVTNLVKKNAAYEAMWDETLRPMMEEAEELAAEYVTRLTRILKAGDSFGLDAAQIADYEELIRMQLDMIRSSRAARTAQRDFEEIMIAERNSITARIRARGGRASTDAPEIQDWWNRFYAGRDRIWDDAEDGMLRVIGDMAGLGERIDLSPLPLPRQVAHNRVMTAEDIGYLFGVSPAEITRGMYVPEMMSLRSEKSFVETVYRRAIRVAKRQGDFTAEDFGYTKERIAGVYQEIIKRLRLRPELQGLAAPKFAQWNALRTELLNLGKTQGALLDEAQMEQLGAWGRVLQRQLQNDPVTGQTFDISIVPPGKDELVDYAAAYPQVADIMRIFNDLAATETNTQLLERGVPHLARWARMNQAWSRTGMGVDSSDRALRETLGEFLESPDGFPIRARMINALDTDLGETFRVYRGGTRTIEARGEDTFISVSLDPGAARGFANNADETIESAIIAVNNVTGIVSMGEVELIVRASIFHPETRTISQWTAKRQSAWDLARTELDLTLPDYEKASAFTAGARFLFPFWTYEAHRWAYLPRMWMRTPGTYAAWGKYENYTDFGYVRIPGTSMEINFLRGGLMMGGLKSLVQGDFPEFYDKYPGLANAFDQAGRFGFFPNIWISGFFALGLATQTGQSQLGEVLPPIASAPMSAMTALFPNSGVVRALRELMFPNRFFDFQNAKMVSIMGGRGTFINDKRILGIELTDDEQAQWNAALPATSGLEFWNNQTALFRWRPEEIEQAKILSREIIAEILGVSVADQDRIAKAGLRLEQFIPFPPELNDQLAGIDDIARFRGLASGLRESAVGREIALQRLFWDKVAEERNLTVLEQEKWDNRWRSGEINRADWEFQTSELAGRVIAFVDATKKIDMFKGMSFTQEERLAFAIEHNIPPTILSPREELAIIYFDTQPEDFRFWDEELKASQIDWSGFFKYRSQIENALSDTDRRLFKARLSRWDTDLQKQRRSDYEQYITPFKASFEFVLGTFDKEQQTVIREFFFTDDSARRVELRKVELEADVLLIANFQTQLTDFRKNLRILDPELDARLLLWGETATPATDAGLARERQLRLERGLPIRTENS